MRRNSRDRSILTNAVFNTTAAGVMWMVAALLVMAATGCTGPDSATRESESSKQLADDQSSSSPPAGADEWGDLAENLPHHSPIVFSVRADRLFANADALRRWLFAEPAMFGENGKSVVSGWQRRWRNLVGRTGGNPLDPDMLESLAIDTSRALRGGLYPVDGGEQRSFLDKVDQVVRQKFSVDVEDGASDDLLDRIRAAQRTGAGYPGGLYAAAERETENLRPNLGARVVIPTTDATAFIDHARDLAELMGYASFDAIDVPTPTTSDDKQDSSEADVLGLYKTGSRLPGLVVRARGEIAVVDVLYRPFEPPRQADVGAPSSIKQALQDAISTYPSGRPDAPAPQGRSIASLSADQAGTSNFIRLIGYLEAVGAVGTTAAERRDKLFTGGVMSTLMTAEKWRIASHRISGLTYSLTGTLGSAERLAELKMTMVGSLPDQPLSVSPSNVSLGVEDRSIAASVDLKPLFTDEWQEWLRVDDPASLMEMGEAARTRPFFSALAMPRNSALAFVNADRIPREEYPAEFHDLHDHRQSLGRFEIATSGIDVRQLRTEPKLATLLTLDESADADARNKILQAFRPVLTDLVGNDETEPTGDEQSDGSSADGSRAVLDRVAEDSLTALPPREDHPVIRYFASARKEAPFFLMTFGLSDEQANGEVVRARTKKGSAADSTLAYARLEPAALFAIVSAVDPRPTEPFDTGILAQRLGPLTFHAKTKRHDTFQTLEYAFTLNAPPDL